MTTPPVRPSSTPHASGQRMWTAGQPAHQAESSQARPRPRPRPRARQLDQEVIELSD